jgi:hypothetical protein
MGAGAPASTGVSLKDVENYIKALELTGFVTIKN